MEYTDGLPDGKLEIFSPKTGKLISESHSKQGKLDGEQARWDDAGNKIFQAKVKNGQYVGVAEDISPTGKVVGQVPYSDGFVNGEVKVWDAETGQLVELTTFVQGQKLGRHATWDAHGNMRSDGVYDNMGLFHDTAASMEASDEEPVDEWEAAVKPANKICVDEWAAYTRKVEGDDVMIGLENMKDWNSMCSDGQHPSS